jgi:tRNA threonylcarbamoyl adenosine modification protein (Sua5/YciO/YrdC/YwlC family)
MAQYFSVHAADPQPRLIRQAAEILRRDGLIIYPTDSCYAFGCLATAAAATERMRSQRGFGPQHHLTLICRDLAQAGAFVRMDDVVFRLIKAVTPGPITFILPAVRELPRRVLHAKRKTIGLRIPSHPVALALLRELEQPLLSATLLLPGADEALAEPLEARAQLEPVVDLIIDAGPGDTVPSSVLDCTETPPRLLRRGQGVLPAWLDAG